jgi:hypothetical protein
VPKIIFFIIVIQLKFGYLQRDGCLLFNSSPPVNLCNPLYQTGIFQNLHCDGNATGLEIENFSGRENFFGEENKLTRFKIQKNLKSVKKNFVETNSATIINRQ